LRPFFASLTALAVVAAVVCGSGKPAQPALLPQGLSGARVPDVELEAFAYVLAPDGGAVARALGLAAPVAPSAVAIWMAPWQGELVWGATLELPSEDAARTAMALLGPGRGHAVTVDNQLAVVGGDSAAATGLASAIQQKGLVALAGRNPGAMAVLAWLPASAPAGLAGPLAVAYAHLSDQVVAELQQRTGRQEIGSAADALRSARMTRAAAAVYVPEGSGPITPGNLWTISAQAAGIAVAPAGVPGALVGSLLSSQAGSLGLKPVSLPGGTAFTRDLGTQHLYVANVGNKVYASFSQDDARAQSLLDTARQGR
jgi:hypothetical protein